MKYGAIYKVILILCAILVLISVGLVWSRWESRHMAERESREQTQSSVGAYEKQEKGAPQISLEAVTEDIEETTIFQFPEESISDEQLEPDGYSPWGELPRCYFVNTENTIDVRNALPVNALARLADDTQQYLDENGINATELYCIDGSVKTDGAETSFQVQCEDGRIITMIYSRDLHFWSFKQER